MTTPSNITSTSTPKDISNYTTFPGKHKSTLKPDRFLTANLFPNINNYAQYPSNDIDNDSDHEYSRSPQITERPRKPYLAHKSINFEF